MRLENKTTEFKREYTDDLKYAVVAFANTDGGKVYIASCMNPSISKRVQEHVLAEYPEAKTEVYSLGGLCSFYAEKGGLIVGFEKN